MNIAVRYQSRGGNTRTAAEIIAESLGVKAEPIDVPLEGNVDVLFLGGGVYQFDADPALKNYLEKLDSQSVRQIVAFSTTGTMKTALNKICEYADKAGIKVNDRQLCIKMMLKGNAIIGRKGGHLSDNQVKNIREFTSEVMNNL